MISSNGKEQSYPAILILPEGNDRLCMVVNEATAKSHKDVMQTKLKPTERRLAGVCSHRRHLMC